MPGYGFARANIITFSILRSITFVYKYNMPRHALVRGRGDMFLLQRKQNLMDQEDYFFDI